MPPDTRWAALFHPPLLTGRYRRGPTKCFLRVAGASDALLARARRNPTSRRPVLRLQQELAPITNVRVVEVYLSRLAPVAIQASSGFARLQKPPCADQRGEARKLQIVQKIALLVNNDHVVTEAAAV